ncbi:MAG: sigma-54-dependent Fis family transcriptional regulator [Proteobacteria bacterium]|nr:sigma-54-dependent Fis family transcriptional regulator [Pseudomonadota bacterium]
MTLVLPRRERHADRVFEVVRGGVRDAAEPVVARSWGRCLNEFQLHPDRPPRQVPLVSDTALAGRQGRLADLLDCARFEMTSLYQQMGDDETAVLLTDTDGVILHMVASADFAAEMAGYGMRVGAIWSEAEAGTNGMGTCLAAAAPVAVRREDHFFTQFTELTCSAVPIYDPAGELTAVLDVSSRSTQAQQHLLVLLGMTARMIENQLIDAQFRSAHAVHFHSRPEFVYTLHEGRLAVGSGGEVLAANRSALFQMGMTTMGEIRGQRFEALFQATLPELLERSRASAYHPVVAYRAHAAHRFFAVVRPPQGAGETAPLMPPPVASRLSPRTPSVAVPIQGGVTFADPRLAQALQVAQRVIARATPVLLSGETGSGKEVFARAVHEASPHGSGPFVAINCASLPENLIESELFGYRAGAFTGAQRTGRRGKIVQADGGTLFLDEIGDMPLDLQARLLRVLEDRQVTPLGTEDVLTVNFQLISASHRDLLTRVEQGEFREDLYYRLSGVELVLPPLRERSDKRELMLALLATEVGVGSKLTQAAEHLLMNHPWPGNVRQLRHVLRAAAALADGAVLDIAHFPSLRPRGEASLLPPVLPNPEPTPPLPPLGPIQANERQVLLGLLEQHRWNVSQVAKVLGVSRNTLYRKLHKLHIPVSHPCA